MAGTRVEHHLRGDATQTRGAGRVARVAAPAALVLVALVGLGSAVALWDVGGPPQLVDLGPYAGDLVLLGLVALFAVPLLVRLLRRNRRPRRELEPDPISSPAPWWARVLALLVIALCVLLTLLVVSFLPLFERDPGTAGEPAPPAAATPQPPDDGGLPPVHWWMVAALALGALAVAGAASRRRPRIDPPAEDDDSAHALLAAVDLSLDDLEHEPDPRRAVIRAYARMERALAAHGLARRPAETPLEYLGRALASLRVGRASVERLGTLFERAKFSQHAIDVPMKTEALAALAALRAELADGAA